MEVIKRDGRIVEFNADKVFNAIIKAMLSCYTRIFIINSFVD